MSEVNRTELRHRALAAAERGAFEAYCADIRRSVWKLRATREDLTGAEVRALGELQDAGLVRSVLMVSFYAPRPVVRTAKGYEALQRWNSEHGEMA